jgi:uncharacterized protein YbaP (TraB family)
MTLSVTFRRGCRAFALCAPIAIAPGSAIATTPARDAYVAAPSAVAAPAPTKHMLFRVRGKTGATVYLLGSVHLLSAAAATLPPEVDSAFADAETIAFEASIDSLQIRGAELGPRALYTGGATLRNSLSPAAVAKAEALLQRYGLSLDQVNAYKPWFVSMVLSQMVMQRAHFEPQYGVDVQLNDRARATHKKVVGLESVDFQLGLFDSLSPADQESMLVAGMGPDSAAKELDAIKDAWVAGDATALDRILNHSRQESPGLVAAVLNNRNRDWIPKIERMLNGPDDALVVVGAAHLVGSDGVVALLRAKGYTVEQL